MNARTTTKGSLTRWAWAVGLCAAALWGTACSSDPEPGPDAGADAAVAADAPPSANPDARPAEDAAPGVMDADVDGGVGAMDAQPGDTGMQGARRFSDFVKELINTQTNATSAPTALPAPGTLIDSEDPREYEDLFP